MKKKTIKLSPSYVLLFIILALYALTLALLIAWSIFASLKEVDTFFTNILGLPKGAPWKWQWGNYLYLMRAYKVPATMPSGFMRDIGFAEQLYNSIMYVIPSAFFASFIPCVTAYLTAKFDYRLSRIVYITVIVTMVLPIVGAYPSELQMLDFLKLYNTFYGAWIQKANFLGMYFLVFYAVFKAIPTDYSEAAYIDGASEFSLLTKVMLPLVRNTFFTVMLIKIIEFWNDYQMPLLYLPSKPTLSFGLYYLSNSRLQNLSNVPMRMTSMVIVMFPIIILFIFFHKKIVGNISIGGIKG